MVFNFFANKGAASLLAELDDDSAPLTGSSSSSGKSDTSIDENNTYTFGTGGNPVFSVPDADVSPAKLRSNVITKVASSYVESNTRSTVATNDTFISYGLKQGHIRVLHRYSEARALLKGHTSPIASLVFLSSHVIASGGQDGKVYVWELEEVEGDENALGVSCVMRAVFSPGCDSQDVYVSRGFASGKTSMSRGVKGLAMVVTVGSSVMVFDVGAMGGVARGSVDGGEGLLDIDPLDPAPHGVRLSGFPLQDTPTCVSTSKRGVLAVGSARGRVYVAQLGSGPDGSVRVAAMDVEVGGGNGGDGGVCGVCGLVWVGEDVLVASVDEGRKHALCVWQDGVCLRQVDTLTLKDTDGKVPYVHVSGVAKRRLVCLADTRNNVVYVVRVGPGREGPAFKRVALFSVVKPILSMFACWNTEAGKLELTCVQTDAITQYYVDGEEEEVEDEDTALGGLTSAEVSTRESGIPEALIVPGVQPSNSTEDFSLMSALLTPSDILSTAEIKSTGSSREKPVDAPVDQTGDTPDIGASLEENEKNGATAGKHAASKPEATKGKKKKNKKEATKAPAPIKILSRDASDGALQGEDGTRVAVLGEQSDELAVGNAQGSVPAELVDDNTSSSALFLAICKENAKQTKAIEKALKEHRKHVDDQIARALEEMESRSAASRKAVEDSLQTVIKDSIRTILPKEVFGAVKTGLDKQLAGAVQQGLSKSVQDSFKQSFMNQIVPAFEAACQNMLTQFDGTLKKHVAEMTKEAKVALSSVAVTSARPAVSSQGQPQSPHSVQSVPSPKEEIETLIRAGNLEQAFRKALSLQDLGVLGWLCGSIDAPSTLSRSPPPLSQMVMLSLLQQLAVDLSQHTTSKLQWIREAAMNIDPRDPVIAHQVKPVLQGVANSLTNNIEKMSPSDASNCKLTIHVVRSQMVG